MYMLVNNVKFPVSEHVKLKPPIYQSPTGEHLLHHSYFHCSVVLQCAHGLHNCHYPLVEVSVCYADIVQNYHSDNNIATFLGCVKECPTTCVNAAKPRFQISKTSLNDNSCPHMSVTESLLMSVCWIQYRGH